MIDWLSQQTGSDVATYIGVLLGISGLVYGGKKVKKRLSQSQKSGNDSCNIQGGRDVKIASGKKK